jgi:tetratricopeptide (TPR) repeat protein
MHPGNEILAAYVDRMLSEDERAGVERHLSTCTDCRDIVTDTALFVLEEREREQVRPAGPTVLRFPRKWIVAGGLGAGLAAAAALILAVWLPSASRTDAAPHLDALIAAYATEPARPVEGRLSGPFEYAPAPSQTRGTSDTEISPDVRIAAGRIEEEAQRDPSPATAWTLGIARLGLRDYDGAIAALEESARAHASAALESDLAAAYLARGRNTGSADDFTKALAAADRALTAQPGLPQALFNRALALQGLRRSDEARSAWQSVATREGTSPWAAEATTRATSIR